MRKKLLLFREAEYGIYIPIIYLMIYGLSKDDVGARVSDIADRLGVTRPSTNSAMAMSSEKGLFTNEKYGGNLFDSGGKKAGRVLR